MTARCRGGHNLDSIFRYLEKGYAGHPSTEPTIVRVMPVLLVAVLWIVRASAAWAGNLVQFDEELLVGPDQKVRFEVRSEVVLKPRFTGVAKVTGAGVRWALPRG